MSQGYYTAQICLNGHVINAAFQRDLDFNQDFCDECGEQTIIKCSKCQSRIKGEYFEGLSGGYFAPNFCINCGHPFEWTLRILDAAKELAAMSEGFSETEMSDFQNSIDNLVKNSPNVEVAKIKFKKYVIKAGKAIGEGVQKILVDIVSESVKKTLTGGL